MSEDIIDSLKDIKLIKDNQDVLRRIAEILDKPIEKDSPAIAREQLQECLKHFRKALTLKCRAEFLYRKEKEKIAKDTGKELKAEARKAVIDGGAAYAQYARDLIEGYYDALKGRASALKSILSSLNDEMRNID